MARIWNYTALNQRETKLYSIGGYNIAGGISFAFLKVVAPVAILLIFVFYIIGTIFGISYFNPLSANFSAKYTIFTAGISIGIGCALWYIMIGGYRLYYYLLAYIKPKKIYRVLFRPKEVTLTTYKVKAMVKSIY